MIVHKSADTRGRAGWRNRNRGRGMRVRDFEETVWKVEGIRIVVRAAENAQVGDYDYTKAASRTFTFQELLDGRIAQLVDPKEVVAINGRGRVVVGQTQLRTIRNSYC